MTPLTNPTRPVTAVAPPGGAQPRGRAVADVLAQADAAARSGAAFVPPSHPTGFTPLDLYLGGGLRGGELTLVGGPQGLGKTVFAMQVARNIVAAGGRATYVSYEHDVEQVLERLLAMEAGLALGGDAATLDDVRHALGTQSSSGSLAERLGPAGGPAVEALHSYGDRLRLVRASGARTGVLELRELVADEKPEPPVLVVDYLQKVSAAHIVGGEDERVTHVVESLKDLALDSGSPVLALVAADKPGLEGRTRLQHLRGSTALAYEADVALLLNGKYDIVARQHLMYGAIDADRYREWVVCSIEKNRNGVAGVDLEFRTHFAHGRYDPHGRVVAESLSDPRMGRD